MKWKRSHHKVIRTLQNYTARHCTREKSKRKTEEKMGGQHTRMDGYGAGKDNKRGWGQRGMEENDCKIFCGAPTVTPTAGYVRRKKWKWSRPTSSQHQWNLGWGHLLHQHYHRAPQLCPKARPPHWNSSHTSLMMPLWFDNLVTTFNFHERKNNNIHIYYPSMHRVYF